METAEKMVFVLVRSMAAVLYGCNVLGGLNVAHTGSDVNVPEKVRG